MIGYGEELGADQSVPRGKWGTSSSTAENPLLPQYQVERRAI